MTFLSNEPLIEAEASHAFIDWPSLIDTEGKTLFFGVGLCTAKEPAVAIPFDILSFFFVAERLKRFFGLSRIIVLIADTHAETNTFMSSDLIRNTRTNIVHTLEKVVRNFSLPNFEILLASQMHQLETFKRINTQLPAIDNQYLHQELADIIWLSKHKNLGIKLGWTIDSSTKPSGHDERFFDTQLLAHQKLPISFIFVKAGRTFDAKRPKASPYIAVRGEHRLLLQPCKQVNRKLTAQSGGRNTNTLEGAKKHLGNIVRLFEKLFIKLPAMTQEQKMQFILNIATQ